jgi:hypothetical protein
MGIGLKHLVYVVVLVYKMVGEVQVNDEGLG